MSDATVTEPEELTPMESQTKDIEERIIHVLQVYPYISRSMLQVAIGPGLSPKFWDPVFQSMLEMGVIKLSKTTVTSPGGRELVKEVYYLPTYPYPPATIKDIEQ